MKVSELIKLLKDAEPNADVVSRGHRDFFYPVLKVNRLLLKRTAVYQFAMKEADAYVDTMKNDQGSTPCVELVIE